MKYFRHNFPFKIVYLRDKKYMNLYFTDRGDKQ